MAAGGDYSLLDHYLLRVFAWKIILGNNGVINSSLIMTFRRVVLPIAVPGILSSLMLTFSVSLDEFVLAFFLAGTDSTLPIFIWSQLRFPNRLPGVLALSTLILAFSFVLVLIAEKLRRMGASASAEGA